MFKQLGKAKKHNKNNNNDDNNDDSDDNNNNYIEEEDENEEELMSHSSLAEANFQFKQVQKRKLIKTKKECGANYNPKLLTTNLCKHTHTQNVIFTAYMLNWGGCSFLADG